MSRVIEALVKAADDADVCGRPKCVADAAALRELAAVLSMMSANPKVLNRWAHGLDPEADGLHEFAGFLRRLARLLEDE